MLGKRDRREMEREMKSKRVGEREEKDGERGEMLGERRKGERKEVRERCWSNKGGGEERDGEERDAGE